MIGISKKTLGFAIVYTSLFFLLFAACWAADPPATPVLRLETGMHTAIIGRIGADRAGTVLVTASEDKTARVWDLATGELKKVLRVPLDQAEDGMLFAVAVSPDGRTAALGGWTGWNWDKKTSIYLFDLSSGTLAARISGVPSLINHLAYSTDGRYLAASLNREKGVRIYNTSSLDLAAKDEDYGEDSYWADFDSEGRMVTGSFDGFVRLYDRAFRLIAKKKAPSGDRPFTVAFSSDGDSIAVGYEDSAKVDVLSGKDLSHRFCPDTSGAGRGQLSGVAWSADGRYLYAGGSYDDSTGMNPIRRWSDGGRGAYRDLAGPMNTVMQILPLSDGRVVFGAYDPAWGVLNRQGERLRFVDAAVADFRGNIENGFKISPDGGRVRFGYAFGGKRPALFSVSDRTLVLGGAAADLKPPTTRADGILVSRWRNSFAPECNGRPLTLKQQEVARSLCIAPDGQSFLLGTEWFVRCYDRDGGLVWRVPAGGAAWEVNVSGDGMIAVAALGDGTLRWYRMKDGREFLAMFPHKDGKRWVAWTPSGYYAASAGGDALIGWHVNRGRDKEPDFFAASQFRSAKYRPDVVSKALETLDESEALRLADEEAGRRRQEKNVEQMLPPVVQVLAPADGAFFSDPNISVRYSVRSPSGEPVTAVELLLDGRPLPGERGIKLERSKETGAFSVTLPERDCEISVVAKNRHAASQPASARLRWKGANPKMDEFVVRPKLYVLAVGVGKYKNSEFDLGFPAKDARDLAEVLSRQKGKLYRDVSVRIVTDMGAAKDDVLDGLDWLERETTDNDVAAFFLAGHGVNDRDGDYYFLPHDADPERLRRTGVPYAVIKDVVSGLPGKVLFFIDTCHSGNVMGKRRGGQGDIIAVVNDLAAVENGVVVFASSTGGQYSLEDSSWGNGAFTKALVEGLSGSADWTGDGRITINEMDLYLSERVKKLTFGKQTPTTSKPETVPDFPVAVK